MSKEELDRVKMIYIVPIGLPGMGKTTLSSALLGIQDYTIPKSMTRTERTHLQLEFIKIDYDDNLTTKTNEYCREHPEIDFHTAVDIVRAEADKWFLETLTATGARDSPVEQGD